MIPAVSAQTIKSGSWKWHHVSALLAQSLLAVLIEKNPPPLHLVLPPVPRTFANKKLLGSLFQVRDVFIYWSTKEKLYQEVERGGGKVVREYVYECRCI